MSRRKLSEDHPEIFRTLKHLWAHSDVRTHSIFFRKCHKLGKYSCKLCRERPPRSSDQFWKKLPAPGSGHVSGRPQGGDHRSLSGAEPRTSVTGPDRSAGVARLRRLDHASQGSTIQLRTRPGLFQDQPDPLRRLAFRWYVRSGHNWKWTPSRSSPSARRSSSSAPCSWFWF